MNCYFSKVTRKMNNRPMPWDRSGRQYFVCPPEVRSTLDKDVFFQPREIRDDFENVIEVEEYFLYIVVLYIFLQEESSFQQSCHLVNFEELHDYENYEKHIWTIDVDLRY